MDYLYYRVEALHELGYKPKTVITLLSSHFTCCPLTNRTKREKLVKHSAMMTSSIPQIWMYYFSEPHMASMVCFADRYRCCCQRWPNESYYIYNYWSAHWPIVKWIFPSLHLAKASYFSLYSFKNHQAGLVRGEERVEILSNLGISTIVSHQGSCTSANP